MKRPELVLLLAIWEFIAAFITLVILAAILLFGFPGMMNSVRYGDRMGYVGAIFGLCIACIILGIYFSVSIAGGIGLLTGKEWGRIVSIVQAAMSLFSIPFGTIIGALSLVYLTRSQVRDYFVKPAIQPPSPSVIPPTVTPPAPPAEPPTVTPPSPPTTPPAP